MAWQAAWQGSAAGRELAAGTAIIEPAGAKPQLGPSLKKTMDHEIIPMRPPCNQDPTGGCMCEGEELSHSFGTCECMNEGFCSLGWGIY